MARKRKPKVRWPDLRTPPNTWSFAEARGVSINPVVTGIGKHPRTISDEDWALSCERDVEANGLEQFLTELLHILRLAIPLYLGEPPAGGEYPRRRSKGKVPLPNVSYPGDPDWQVDDWNEQMVAGIVCNPVYAGIPPFPQMIDDETWIKAGVTMAREEGMRQYLVNLLYQLKNSIRSVSSHP